MRGMIDSNQKATYSCGLMLDLRHTSHKAIPSFLECMLVKGFEKQKIAAKKTEREE